MVAKNPMGLDWLHQYICVHKYYTAEADNNGYSPMCCD